MGGEMLHRQSEKCTNKQYIPAACGTIFRLPLSAFLNEDWSLRFEGIQFVNFCL